MDIPTPWVNSLVIVEKRDGSSRLCLDPRDLNKAICREHHGILIAEDIASRLSGKKVFSVVDEKDGFWQVPLDDESSCLYKFNTPYGRYRFNKCPSASSPPQRSFRRGINPYLEKLTVWKSSSMTSLLLLQMSKNILYDQIMVKLLPSTREGNVKFNTVKLQYKVSEVKYMENIASESGLKPDTENVRARCPRFRAKKSCRDS